MEVVKQQQVPNQWQSFIHGPNLCLAEEVSKVMAELPINLWQEPSVKLRLTKLISYGPIENVLDYLLGLEGGKPDFLYV